MKIATQITLGFILLTLLVVMVGYVGLSTSRHAKDSFDGVTNENFPVVVALQQLNQQGLHVVVDATRYAMLHLDGTSDALQESDSNSANNADREKHVNDVLTPFDHALEHYNTLIREHFPEESENALKITALANDIKRISLQILALTQQHESEKAIHAATEEIERVEEEFVGLINDALEQEQGELAEMQTRVDVSLRQSLIAISTFSIMATLGTLAMGALFARTLSRPLRMLEQAAIGMSQGNLDQHVSINSRDEIGTLAQAFNRMSADIRNHTVSRDYVENILSSMGEALIVLDEEGRVKDTNFFAQRLLQYGENELRGMHFSEIMTENLPDIRERLSSEGKSVTLEGHLQPRDGTRIPAIFTVSPLSGDMGKNTGCVLIAQDFTERKRDQEHLQKLASYDTLTGLPNRMLLMDRLQQSIGITVRHKRILAVLFCDLDRFKVINDSLGHVVGDRLLQNVAERLKSCVRKDDTVARIGGDEFVIILNEVASIDDITRVAEKLMESISGPMDIDGQRMVVTASIGISVYPNDGDDPDMLLRQADIAMYRAKEEGKNNFRMFTEDMNSRVKARFALESELRRAIEEQELELYYQPQVRLSDQRIVGAEALLRWKHPERGVLSPLEFLPIAEETGLILPLGEWILRSACREATAWQQNGPSAIRVGVNIANRQFFFGNLLETVKHALGESGLDADCLDLEITESIVMTDANTAQKIMEELKNTGVQLSIDDFGTGYSSLSHLRHFPLDTLKIDQSFVKDIAVDQDDESIIMMIIAMAKQLRLRVIAEGVELAEQRDFLAGLDCDEVQGYFYSKPVPAEEFRRLLQQSTIGPAA